MGGVFSSVFNRLWGAKEVRILILGLDGAGKTTLLYRMQVGEVVTTIPTVPYLTQIGFNVETVVYKNIKLQVWDLGGQTSIRPYWRCYCTMPNKDANTDAVIYVVDSCDAERMDTAKHELHQMLSEEELQGAALLVFANKQDQQGSLDVAKVSELLGLTDLKARTWTIFKCSAKTGLGVQDGMDWLVNVVASK